MKKNTHQKLYLWTNPPGNNHNLKEAKMEINHHQNKFISYFKFLIALKGDKYKDNKKIIDTFTYNYLLKNNQESKKFQDQPYLIPYQVPNAKQTVIIVPGGGFAYKSIITRKKEGEKLAKELNKNNINAFILYYRSNPYNYPIPYLDLERAIRYLTYNYKKLKIDQEKISLIGFSAGAHMTSFLINKMFEKDYQPKNYQKDIIDKTSYKLEKVALIYPVLTFNKNISMIFSLFKKEEILNNQKEILEKLDLVKNYKAHKINHFIAYSQRDNIVPSTEIENYIKVAKQKNTPLTIKKVKYQLHGFSKRIYLKEYLKWLNKEK